MVNGLKIYTPRSLNEVIEHLNGNLVLPPIEHKSISSFKGKIDEDLDFADVKGQDTAKRALEIAAAGNHNVLFTGPPGSGKTMLAKRLPSILPPLSFEESLETTKIHSIAGILPQDKPILLERPFRIVHHSISNAGLIGGGNIPRPGEVSLAHRGILFLDELPEFSRSLLDLMRQPLEDKFVNISRVHMSLRFPTDFMLLTAMNPCPCGFMGDEKQDCGCSASQIQKYRSKISGPLLDRIDLQIEMPRLSYNVLNSSKKGEASSVIGKRVLDARKKQQQRYDKSRTLYNGVMTRKELEKYCTLDKEGHSLLSQALQKLNLSGRAHDRILKVARTIADLEDSRVIRVYHVAEAVNYRCLDRELNF